MLSLLFHSAFYNAPFLVTALFVFILSAAAVYDIKTFTIPHVFTYAVFALFIILTIYTGQNLAYWGWHLVSALICLIIAFILFATGIMGGGDVKIFTAIGLWVHPMGLFGLLPSIAIVGACISIGVVLYSLIRTPVPSIAGTSFIDRLKSVKSQRVPYGPAIAIGTTLYLQLSGNLINLI